MRSPNHQLHLTAAALRESEVEVLPAAAAGELFRSPSLEGTRMMPVPTHLNGLAVAKDTRLDESPLEAWVRCPCGGDMFTVLYPGKTVMHEGRQYAAAVAIGENSFFLIRARCVACGVVHLLFDADFHGWNGWICHCPEQAALSRPPLVPWCCPRCDGDVHRASVRVYSEGRADFARYAAVNSLFPVAQWADGFGWFDVCTECARCGLALDPWATWETM